VSLSCTDNRAEEVNMPLNASSVKHPPQYIC